MLCITPRLVQHGSRPAGIYTRAVQISKKDVFI
jgi:hypothetical protein